MSTFQVLLHIVLLCPHSVLATACDARYTKQTLYDYHCIAKFNVTLWQTERPQCVLNCLRFKTCQYINHNHANSQCDLGLSKRKSLERAIDSAVNVFGTPRDTCVQWGPSQEHGRVPVQVSYHTLILHLARIVKKNGTMLVGKFIKKCWNILGQQRRW